MQDKLDANELEQLIAFFNVLAEIERKIDVQQPKQTKRLETPPKKLL